MPTDVTRLHRFPAVLGALVALALLPAGAAADRRGEQVSGKPAEARTTVELHAQRLGRLPDRVQPREHELEPPEKAPNPDSPGRADGGTVRRSALRAATVSSTFDFGGPTLNDAGAFPPDSQGAVGPTQYIAMINGRVRSYAKATGLPDGVLNVDTDVFWLPAMTPDGIKVGNVTVTSNFTSDPRIRYDRLTQRWFAVMIDVPNNGSLPNRIMVAVSDSATITGSTVWSFFSFQASPTNFADYPTLGIDANALYIGTNDFSTAGSFRNTSAFVVQKSSILGGGPIHATAFHNLLTSAGGAGPWTPQGVDNPDPAAAKGYFAGVDNVTAGRLDIRTVTDPGGASPTLSSDFALTVPATTQPFDVPQAGGLGATQALDALDDRLYAAQIRDGHLWTAHNISVDAAGSAAVNNRTAARWYEVDLAGTPSLVQSGTVFDPAATNPRMYWIPTLAVNGQGDMVIGGSTAGVGAHPDAWFAGRRRGDPPGTVTAPTRYTAATADYNPCCDNNKNIPRWGDYSFTSVDPTDDQTIWTIQEYVASANVWGTRIAKVLAPSPMAPTGAGQTLVPRDDPDVQLQLTGPANAGWFDPGAGFANHLLVAVGCGIVVDSVTYDGPATLTVDLDTTGASRGACDVTVTNPDGQSATAAGLLETDRAPVGVADAYAVDHAAPVDVAAADGVLANDSDPDGDPVTAVKVADPANGTLTFADDGSFTYTPDADFGGTDSFSYRVDDGARTSPPTAVTLNVASGTSTGGGGGGGGGSADTGGGGGGSTGGGPATATITTQTPPLQPAPSVTDPFVAVAPSPTASATPTARVVRCVVPALRRHSLAHSRKRLKAAHCALGSVRRVRSRAVRRGRVVRSVPGAGTVLAAGAKVALRIRR